MSVIFFRFKYETCTTETRLRNGRGWRLVANPDLEVRSSRTEPCRIVYPSVRPDSPPNVYDNNHEKLWQQFSLYRSPFDAQGDVWQLGKDSLDCHLNHCTWSFALNFRAFFNSSEAWKWHGDSSSLYAVYGSRVQLKCDGTRWRTGGKMKGKLANGVGTQYPSRYLGTWCIQHYYRWCAHLGRQ